MMRRTWVARRRSPGALVERHVVRLEHPLLLRRVAQMRVGDGRPAASVTRRLRSDVAELLEGVVVAAEEGDLSYT